MGRSVLLGFAGPGKVSDTNIDDLLTDYLEDDDDVRVVVPASDEFLTKTLLQLLDWTVDSKIPYEAVFDAETDKNLDVLDHKLCKNEIETRNVAMGLVNRLAEGKKDGDQAVLIVAWGDDGDANTEVLVDLAKAKDLRVLDITAGLDDKPSMEDLNFGDEEEPEPKPEPRRRRTAKDQDDEQPAEEEEKPRPRRGAPRKAAETPSEPTEKAEPESVEAEVSHARQKAEKAAEAPEEDDVVLSALKASRWLAKSLDASHAAMTGRDEPVDSELTRQLERAIKLQIGQQIVKEKPESAEAEPDKPARRPGRPRSDGSPAQPRSAKQRGVKEWFDKDQGEDGEWVRAGRGRLPKDVEVRTVDPKTGKVIED